MIKYLNSYTPIIITCPAHGDFEQTPNEHLRSDCPKCAGGSISKISQRWLDSFNNSNIEREKKITINNKKIIVDGYDPRTNTCYEFHGDFWHGNPSVYPPTEINRKNGMSFGELYNKTLEKEKTIRELGFNLVCIWEDAWKKFNS